VILGRLSRGKRLSMNGIFLCRILFSGRHLDFQWLEYPLLRPKLVSRMAIPSDLENDTEGLVNYLEHGIADAAPVTTPYYL
jgi:hypothetical protein